MYRTDVYYLSKTLADLPVYIAFPFLFVAISYFAIGLNPGVDRFFICCGITILVANVATSFGKIQFEIMQKNKLFLIQILLQAIWFRACPIRQRWLKLYQRH